MNKKKWIYRVVGIFFLLSCLSPNCWGWGFFAHKRINHQAVFSLPPQMMLWYKPHIKYITRHAPDPDKRRYAVKGEAPHHFIDIDHYGSYPFSDLPRDWTEAVDKFSKDTLQKYGTVPWYALKVFYKLQHAFERKDFSAVLRHSVFLGHYIADACVPLHATSNYDGQKTNQKGIHALWESEIPELFADTSFQYWNGKAEYVKDPSDYIWNLVLISAKEADSVLTIEKALLESYPAGEVHAFIDRKGSVVRRFSVGFSSAYNQALNGMVNRKMNQAIHAVASLWYTAWVNAGQPMLKLKKEKVKAEEHSGILNGIKEAPSLETHRER